MKENQTNDQLGELLLVQAIFRHGARTPIWQYPGSPNAKSASYPEGMGGLSAAGKKEMFRLGQILRNRYDKYLDGVLLKNINAQSSPLRRCLESALSVLGGMFPPDESQIWSHELPVAQHWQPIGVASSDAKLGSAACPEAEKLENEGATAESFRTFLESNQDFLEKISEHSGMDTKKAWWIILGVFDAMVCEKHYFGESFQRPEWLDKVGSDTWDRLKTFREKIFARTSNLPKRYFQLRTGPLVQEWLDNLNNAASKKGQTEQSDNNELFLYSTHDTLLVPLLQLLGFNDRGHPGFGSALIIELRKDPKTQVPNIHLFYADGDKNHEIEQLHLHQSNRFKHLNGRTSHCSLDHFTEALRGYLPVNGEVEDNVSNPFRL